MYYAGLLVRDRPAHLREWHPDRVKPQQLHPVDHAGEVISHHALAPKLDAA